MSKQINKPATVTIVCMFCSASFTIPLKEFAEGGCECPDCESELQFADTLDQQLEWNRENLEDSRIASQPTHYRIMLEGEDHTLSCLNNNVPAEWADMVCAGYQTHYTEGQRVFLEPEETMADLRRMCDSHDEY